MIVCLKYTYLFYRPPYSSRPFLWPQWKIVYFYGRNYVYWTSLSIENTLSQWEVSIWWQTWVLGYQTARYTFLGNKQYALEQNIRYKGDCWGNEKLSWTVRLFYFWAYISVYQPCKNIKGNLVSLCCLIMIYSKRSLSKAYIYQL